MDRNAGAYGRIAELAATCIREDSGGDVKYVVLGPDQYRELAQLLHSVGALSAVWVPQEEEEE